MADINGFLNISSDGRSPSIHKTDRYSSSFMVYFLQKLFGIHTLTPNEKSIKPIQILFFELLS